MRNREAALRFGPSPKPEGDQGAGRHVELRIGDAASSPHPHQGAPIRADVLGWRKEQGFTALVSTGQGKMSGEERKPHTALPESLTEALKS